jgi:hypothetical protein
LLSIKANLENVTNLVPAADDFEFFFGVSARASAFAFVHAFYLSHSAFVAEMHFL